MDWDYLRLVVRSSRGRERETAATITSLTTACDVCCCSVREDPTVYNLDRLFWAVRAVQVAVVLDQHVWRESEYVHRLEF